jgi:hypothetical protein
LTTLQAQLAQTDLTHPVAEAMSFERVLDCYIAENAWKTKTRAKDTGRIMLWGWLCDNLVLIANWDQREKEAIDSQSHQFRPRQIDEVENEKTAIKHPRPGNVMAVAGTLYYHGALEDTAYSQNMVNETRIVCALELYLTAYHAYPEHLGDLTPKFTDKLPVDIIGGAPLKYHQAPDGAFVLYSIGWNGTDDGGVTIKGKTWGDYSQGDWVWPPL